MFKTHCILWNGCTFYETMDTVFRLNSEIKEIDDQKSRKLRFFSNLFRKKPIKAIFWKLFRHIKKCISILDEEIKQKLDIPTLID